MGEAYRGLTLKFGATDVKLSNTLRSIKRAAADANSELRVLKSTLKLDPSSTRAISRNIAQLGESASIARVKGIRLREAFENLSTQKLRSVDETVGELAQRTENASLAASQAKERYTQACAAIAAWRRGINKSYNEAKKLKGDDVVDLFKGMKEGREDIEAVVRALQDAGVATDGVREKARELGAAWHKADAENEDMKLVAQLKSLDNQIVKTEAEARDFAAKMVEAMTAPQASRLVSQLKLLDASLDAADAAARKFRADFKADPSNVQKAAQYVHALSAQYTTAETKAKLLQVRIDALSRDSNVSRLANSMKPLPAIIENSKNNMVELQTRIRMLVGDLEDARDKLKGMQAGTDEFKQQKAAITAVETQLEELNAEFKEMSANHSALTAANELRELRAQASEASTAVNSAATAYRKLASVKFPASSLTNVGMSFYATLTPAVMFLRTYAVQAARDIDAAYRDMRKTVNGTEEDFEHLKEAAIEFGSTHVTSADTILEIEAMGGQLGILVENLEAFATTVSNLDIATNMDSEDISVDLGKMATVLGMTVDEYDNFGDSLVRLGNSMPALEGDIMTIATRMMGMGKVAGMSADQILAWSTAATAMGQKPYAAGSSLGRFINNLNLAVADNGSKLEKWAQIAGMSADQFADAFGKDASAAMYEVIDGLGDMQRGGENVAVALADLGIKGVQDRQLMLGLTQQMANGTKESNVLHDALLMSSNAYKGVSDQWGKAGDAAIEAQKKSEGFSGVLQQLINVGQQFAESLGVSVLPLLSAFLDIARQAADAFGALPGPVRGVMLAMTLVGSGIGPLFTTIGAIVPLANQLGSAERVMAKTARANAKENEALAKSLQVEAREAEQASIASMKEADSLLEMAVAANDAALAEERLNVALKKEADANAAAAEATQMNAEANMLLGKSGIAADKAVRQQSETMRGFKSIAKGIGYFAAFDVAVTAVVMLGEAIANAYEETKQFEKATDGLVNAARNSAISLGGMSDSFGDVVEIGSQATAMVKDVTEGNAALADSIAKRNSEAQGQIGLLNKAKAVISEYGNTTDHTASEMGRFKQAVDTVNSLCGTQYTVVDLVTGAIKDENGALVDVNGELMKFIESTKASIREQALMGDLTEAMTQQEEAVLAYSKALDEYRRARAAYEADPSGNLQQYAQAEGTYQKAKEDLAAVMTVVESYEDQLGSMQKVANDLDVTTVDVAKSMTTLGNALGGAGSDKWMSFMTKLGQAGADIEGFRKLTEAQQIDLGTWFQDTTSLTDFINHLEQLNVKCDETSGVVPELFNTIAQAGMSAAGMTVAVDDETDSLDELGTEAEEAMTAVERFIDSSPALQQMFEQSGMSVGDFGNALAELGFDMSKLSTSAEEMAQKVSDGFNKITVDQEMTLGQYMENLQENTRIVSEWGDNLKTLYDRAGDESTKAWISSIAEAGPEQAQVVAEMTQMTDDELKRGGELYAQSVQTAWDAALDSAGATSKEVGDAFSSIDESVGSAMDSVVEEADKASAAAETIGERVAAGVQKAKESIGESIKAAVELDRASDIDDKDFKVDAKTAIAESNVKNLYWWYSQIKDKTVNININTNKKTTTTTEGGSASGGIVPGSLQAIPRNAKGGVGRVVTRPTMTNYGWVGEDGWEAIIPLSNTHYVKPFARAVAAEIGKVGAGGVTNYYSVNGMTLAPGSDGARALEALYDAIRLEEAV